MAYYVQFCCLTFMKKMFKTQNWKKPQIYKSLSHTWDLATSFPCACGTSSEQKTAVQKVHQHKTSWW